MGLLQNGQWVDQWYDTGATGGLNNHVFVARSTRPDGGFQKWNGSGLAGPMVRCGLMPRGYGRPLNRPGKRAYLAGGALWQAPAALV